MRRIFVVLLLLSCCIVTSAQSSSSHQLYFNFLGVKDGLPEGSANCLLQDKLGYLWIGTQNGLVRYDGYHTKTYQFENIGSGLVNIANFFEDHSGNLWLGTYPKGLFYYDRPNDRFVNYNLTPSTEKIKEDYVVMKIIDDDNGNLWMTSRNYRKNFNAVIFFDTKTKQTKRYSKVDKEAHYVNADAFYDLYRDVHGTIWIGTSNGFYDYDKAKDSFSGHFNTTDSLQQRGTWQLTQDSINTDILWMTGWNVKKNEDEGLWRYDIKQQTLKKFMHDAKDTTSIGYNDIVTMKNFRKGFLWIGTDTGLSIFNTTSEKFENYSPKDARKKSLDRYIRRMFMDADGNLWCQSIYGLLFFNSATKTFIRYTNANNNAEGMQSNSIRSMLLARDGILWFGAEQVGLQWINTGRSKFTLYKDNPGRPHHFSGGFVNEFAEAADGSLWLTAANGLYHWQPATDSFTKVILDPHAANDLYTNSVAIDKEGLVWCRSYGSASTVAGIYSYNPITKKIVNYRHNDKDTTSLPEDNVRAMKFDNDDILWIGTFGNGISSFDKKTGKFTKYRFIPDASANDSTRNTQVALDDDEVQTIYIDKGNTVWVGTNNGNLNKFHRDDKSFTHFDSSIPGLSTIMSAYKDDHDNLWVGSYMSGLFRFYGDSGKYKKYTEADGLLYDGCWGINEDDKGNIWIASSRGLTILDPTTNTVRTISTANGLPAEHVSFNLFKTKDGHFLSGSKEGFFSWKPNDFAPEKNLPPLMHIESITFPFIEDAKDIDSSVIAFGKNEINLHYNENRITFSYVGLQYQSPELLQYAYKLDGYDDDWESAGTQRQVTYTNLSPGTYTFHIKAKNSDGVWSVKEDSIIITIAPPWWQTWWAYLIYALVVIAAIWGIIVYRSARLKRENKVLEEKVNERTSQLNESITELKATQNQLVQSEKMASLGELTAGIAHEIQNPLNFVNNFADVNKELADELKSELGAGNLQLATEIANDIKDNSDKISHHGRRADAIVKGMLQHSRTSAGQKELTDINALVDEYLRLSYHGLRAKDQTFNATMHLNLDETIGKINIVPQNIGRVLLNLFNNAFYAVSEKRKMNSEKYKPTVSVSTKKQLNNITIIVTDNGNGVPKEIADKIFQPFFTTKPTGQGTGLGLSLSYDIITKEHQGKIELESIPGEGAAFTITLPV
ncbi:MAG: two-component regulator propeller domain-containing protein [Chitinophagaceae bacterium]